MALKRSAFKPIICLCFPNSLLGNYLMSIIPSLKPHLLPGFLSSFFFSSFSFVSPTLFFSQFSCCWKAMDKRRRKQAKTSSGCSEEVSSIEWEFINMSEQEEDLIHRMYKLVGDRWALIAGRIPGRKAEEIERFWIMRHGEGFASRRKEVKRHGS
ncbi:hypothetical protein I3760_02G039900 [Carya illinoinensis]|uniref:Myb-like domain-containing protein n=2 Tax=Carya illinoinensis TaxID=32201 RepID=A0A922JZ75_CARIL|nr:transcription factor CPC-like isoform X2 [Carya illinoinensis]KAG2720532.1 hypothetical protein I3760_02G039900 [Carya illinoinensis]KAG6725600.1 hypothetical protein I3842_02G039700 [Carya illinoinensis]